MDRTLRVHWPMVRMTAGSSFGPMTTSATMPMSRNSVQLMSNMKYPPPHPLTAPPPASAPGGLQRLNARVAARALDLALGLRGLLDVAGTDGLVINRLDGRVGLALRGLVVRHAFLEGFDALGDVTHHLGDLAAPAKDQKQDRADDQPMPNAQRAHEFLRPQRHSRPETDDLART